MAWKIGNCILNCDVNPDEVRVDTFEKKFTNRVKYPRTFFVKLEHKPTGITVTKRAKSQIEAASIALDELDELVNAYNESQ